MRFNRLKGLCFYIVLLVLPLWGNVYSQELFPADGEVFRDDVVPVVRITIDQDSLEAIYANPGSDHEFPAVFDFDNGFVTEHIDLVGFRCRGNTSRSSRKKSFKISFNSFNKSQKFFGLEKMNLNGEHNDPSVIRSKLGWEICKDLGLPASRSNHTLLYVNDEFWGVYIHVEHVDEEFVGLRFGSKKGNLYKCLWPADLSWQGDDPENYKMNQGSRRAYQLKTNEEVDDYTDLMEFIGVLNNTPLNELPNELPAVFNVEGYLSAIVLDVFIGNWDGPIFNKNNFYLYHNPESDVFEYVPYDLDNTFGIDWFNVDWEERDVYNWSSPTEARPIYERIMAVPAFRNRYTELFHLFLQDHILNGELEEDISRLRNLIAARIPDDPFYPLDYGWNFTNFLQSYSNPLNANHVKSGLLSYIQNRTSSALSQLDPLGIWNVQTVGESGIYPNPADDYLVFKNSTLQQADLLSLTGQVIMHWEFRNSNRNVSVAGVKPGTYLLKQKLASGEITSQLLLII